MEISLRATLGGEVTGDGGVLVPGRLLTDPCRLLSDDTVTLAYEKVSAGATVFRAAAGLDSIWGTNVGVSLIRIDPRGNRVVGVSQIASPVFPSVGEGSVWVSSDITIPTSA